jgi:uncharacterized membrane protein (UPF0127 family)
MMNERLPTWLALAAICVATGAAAQDQPQSLPKVRLNVGILNINAEFAKSEEEREIGLMFRTAMAVNDGMIFAFERAGQQCFWMKNTLIPLDVAFIAADGVIVNIDQMKAQTLDSHCSEKPVPYVLEMNDGWFAKRGIRAGQKVKGLPPLPR